MLKRKFTLRRDTMILMFQPRFSRNLVRVLQFTYWTAIQNNLQSQYQSMTILTLRRNLLITLKRYLRMLQLQNYWKKCEFARTDESKFLLYHMSFLLEEFQNNPLHTV